MRVQPMIRHVRLRSALKIPTGSSVPILRPISRCGDHDIRLTRNLASVQQLRARAYVGPCASPDAAFMHAVQVSSTTRPSHGSTQSTSLVT